MTDSLLNVAAIQLASAPDIDANFTRLDRLLPACQGADLIALPEMFAWRGAPEAYRGIGEPCDGPLCTRIASLARRTKAWILAGSIAETEGARLYNTSLLFTPTGTIAASYRKIHLFDTSLAPAATRESAIYTPGDTPTLTAVNAWPAGLSICYDLRFPELYRDLVGRGAELLFAPSDFTRHTGRDHWTTLVRARAIENQCFVIAPNQSGTNPATGIESHGHSLVIDPWGDILAEGPPDGEAVLRAQLDRRRLRDIRTRLPALQLLGCL